MAREGGSTDSSADTGAGASESDTPYGGVLGAFPYAFRSSESRLFRSYVVLGGLLAVVVALAFVVATLVAFRNSFASPGGLFTFSRAFVVVVGTLVAVPVVAPVLLVARRHRRSGSTRTYDRALAAGGYVYAATLYLALVISAPPAYRDDPSGPIAPVVEFLYGLPQLAGLLPPLLAVGVGYLLHRRYRKS